MGRKAKLKQARALQRVFEGAFRLEAQAAKKPCESCAFADPEAWVADVEMAHKLLECLTGTAPDFYCHEGMAQQIRPDGTAGEWLPPRKSDGSMDLGKMTRCGGYLRFAAKYRFSPEVEQRQAITDLQRHMVGRFLTSASDYAPALRHACGGNAALLAEALNRLAAWKKEDSDGARTL
jgi:hypothetical protein